MKAGSKKLDEFSKLIWHLKGEDAEFGIRWEIIGVDIAYTIGNGFCRLCSLELFLILKSRDKMLKS